MRGDRYDGAGNVAGQVVQDPDILNADIFENGFKNWQKEIVQHQIDSQKDQSPANQQVAFFNNGFHFSGLDGNAIPKQRGPDPLCKHAVGGFALFEREPFDIEGVKKRIAPTHR